MIVDKIENAALYFQSGERMSQAFRYLSENNLKKLADGRHEIDGDKIYAVVSSYVTKNAAGSNPEAHRKYTDIQCVVSGTELIGYAPDSGCRPVSEYKNEKDFILYNEPVSFVKIEPGMFAVFFPGELHLPGIKSGFSEDVKKIVIKVLFEI